MRDPFRLLRSKEPSGHDIAGDSPRSLGPDEQVGCPAVEKVAVPMPIAKALITIANHAWKATSRIPNPDNTEPGPEMKRIHRSLFGIMETLKEIGIEVRNHTGETFDYGLPLKVITTQPTPGIDKEVVLETLRPTVFWNNNIVQMGEVIISTPIKSGDSHD